MPLYAIIALLLLPPSHCERPQMLPFVTRVYTRMIRLLPMIRR